MACRLDIEQLRKDLIAGGATESRADEILSSLLVTSDVQGASNEQLKYMLNSDASTQVKTAAATKITELGLSNTLLDEDLKNNESVVAAWQKKGVNISSLDGVFDKNEANNQNNQQYLGSRLAAGDPDAKEYVKTVIGTGSTKEKIQLMNTLAQHEKYNTQTEIQAVVGTKAYNEYAAYYKNPNNIDWSTVKPGDFVTYGNDISVSIDNPLIPDLKVNIVKNGNLLGPDGKYIDGFDENGKPKDVFGVWLIPGEYGKDQTWTINLDKLAEIYSIEDPNKRTAAFNQIATDLANGKLKEWYTCSGKGCPTETTSAASASGGGGGGGYASRPSTTESNPSLYVESNEDASVYVNGTLMGRTNTIIKMESGTYTVETRKKGFKRVTRATTIGKYPVNITMNMYRLPTGPATFINEIGGLQNLTKTHALYLFAIYKARVTGVLDWRALATELEITTNAPEQLALDDVKYVWYLANGEPGKAAQLVTDGKVSLADGEE